MFFSIFSNKKWFLHLKNLETLKTHFAYKIITFLVILKVRMLKTILTNNIYSSAILKNSLYLIELSFKIIIIQCIIMKILKNFKLGFVDTQQMNGTNQHIHKSNNSNHLKLKNWKIGFKVLNNKNCWLIEKLKPPRVKVDLQLY